MEEIRGLLIVLWVRSYWAYFDITLPASDRWLGSFKVWIKLLYFGAPFGSLPFRKKRR